MDAELRQKHAPKRDKRHAHVRDFNAVAEWAESLDWKNNDYDYYRLFRAVRDRLDLEYREELGLCLSQLVELDELAELTRSTSAHYASNERDFQILGIYVYLLSTMRIQLAGRLREVLGQRSVDIGQMSRESGRV